MANLQEAVPCFLKDKDSLAIICRICTFQSQCLKNIFEEANGDILDALISCTDLKFSESDNLPKQICLNCEAELKRLKNFRLKIYESDKLLRRYVSDQKTISTENKLNQAPNKPYLCSVCGMQCTHLSTYIVHRRLHTGERPYNCSNCSKEFTSASARALHVKRKSCLPYNENKKTDTFLCYICGKVVLSDLALRDHIMVHNCDTPFQCNTCNKSFARMDHLKSHMRRHTGERPYKCKFCEKSFSQKSTLQTHITIHNGKTYSCDVCDKTFPRPAHLRRHQTIHQEVKKFACSICDKKFNIKKSLEIHENTHSGIKPYKCDTCDSYFSHKYSLVKHMAIHTGDQSYLCDLCGSSFALSKHLKSHIDFAHQNQDIVRQQPECMNEFFIYDEQFLKNVNIENNFIDNETFEIFIENDYTIGKTPLIIVTSQTTDSL